MVGDEASARTLIPQLTVKIKYMTSTSTKEEVEEAIKKTLAESTPENMEAWLSPTTLRGTRLAKVNRHIRVGWVHCAMLSKECPARCYKCLGYGHSSPSCKGPESSRLCWKCGKEEHLAQDCKEASNCYLCEASEPHAGVSPHAGE